MDYLNNMFKEDGNKSMWRYMKNKKSSSSGVGTLHAERQTAIDPIVPKKIDPRKAGGADKILGAFLKECAHEITPMHPNVCHHTEIP